MDIVIIFTFMTLKWPFWCRSVVKKLLTHSRTFLIKLLSNMQLTYSKIGGLKIWEWKTEVEKVGVNRETGKFGSERVERKKVWKTCDTDVIG